MSMPYTKAAFDALLARAQEVCSGLCVRLVVDPRAGMHGGQTCSRAYAYCAPDPKTPKRPRSGRKRATGEAFVIAVAPKIEDADDGRMEGLICHELAHAILLHLGYDEHTERDADLCAEQVFDVCIYYDAADVQTTDAFAPRARRPRPHYLDDEHGMTRTK